MRPLAESYDIIIAGGGMVGATLAATLAARPACENLNILVVERFAIPDAAATRYQPSFDMRATALSLGSQRAYERMGLWAAMQQHAHPINRVHVSTQGHFGNMIMSAEQEQLPSLGHVIENAWLGRVLLEHLRSQTQVHYHCPARIQGVSFEAKRARVTITTDDGSDPVTCHAALVVIADGAGSHLAENLGIRTTEQSYGHQAIVANIGFTEPHAGIAYERFTSDGPLAILPMVARDNCHRAGLVLTLPDQMADEVLLWPDTRILKHVQEKFGYRLGRFTRLGPRSTYSLRATDVSEQVRRNVVVLGNAAHLLNPAAGQGFNLSMRDVLLLADSIEQERLKDADIGDLQYLQTYESKRRDDQWQTSKVSGALPGLFATSNPLVALPRDAALVGLGLSPAPRRWFVQRAAGIGA